MEMFSEEERKFRYFGHVSDESDERAKTGVRDDSDYLKEFMLTFRNQASLLHLECAA